MSDSAAAPAPPGAWRRLRRNPIAVGALILLVLLVYFTIDGPRWFNYNPQDTTTAQFQRPSREHPFGTDVNGRDVLSRVVQGARISLVVGACGAFVSFLVGTAYGMISGYFGGRLDELMMRILDVLYGIPRLLLIIIAIFAFDPPLRDWLQAHDKLKGLVGYSRIMLLIITLGLNEWLSLARIVRGQVLSLKQQQFVLAARALGQSHARIIIRHLLPNLLGIVMVYLTLTVPAVILDESFLSFLGLGIQAPQASWGTLLSDGANVINPVRSYWWLLLFPALAMSLTLVALNFLGDGIRDALDPRQKR
jgi:peptide/nickel transport system permease protein/oligopeptide transport system permease protein